MFVRSLEPILMERAKKIPVIAILGPRQSGKTTLAKAVFSQHAYVSLENYDTRELVEELRGMNITPHVAQNITNRRSAVDERTTRHAGYEVSQRKRKRVEQSFGWMKMIGMLKKVKLRGIDKVGWLFTFTGAVYNLCRLRNLMARA